MHKRSFLGFRNDQILQHIIFKLVSNIQSFPQNQLLAWAT